MTTKDSVLNAIKDAAHEAASYMTLDLRDRQTSDGWAAPVVDATNVTFDGAKFSAEVAPSQGDAGFIHEYGNGAVQPTATLRKYSSDAPAGEAALIQALSSKIGGLL